MTEAAALHARDDLFAKHITPEPAEEASPGMGHGRRGTDDDEDGTPPHADADEPELIDMPAPPASFRGVNTLCLFWNGRFPSF